MKTFQVKIKVTTKDGSIEPQLLEGVVRSENAMSAEKKAKNHVKSDLIFKSDVIAYPAKEITEDQAKDLKKDFDI
jgi:hypothetical protein